MARELVTADEVKFVLGETGITQKACARNAKLPPQYLSEFVKGKRLLSQEHLISLSNYVDRVRAIL